MFCWECKRSSRLSDNQVCSSIVFSPSARALWAVVFVFVCWTWQQCVPASMSNIFLFTYFFPPFRYTYRQKTETPRFRRREWVFMLNNWEQQTWNVAWNEWLSSQRNNIIRPSLVSDFSLMESGKRTEKRVRCLSVRFQIWTHKASSTPTIDNVKQKLLLHAPDWLSSLSSMLAQLFLFVWWISTAIEIVKSEPPFMV